jgi:uncharacterized protein (DUF433 family)
MAQIYSSRVDRQAVMHLLEIEARMLRIFTKKTIGDKTGAIRVGNSRVLLETVIRAFQDGAAPESIVNRYTTLSLSDVYNTIGYYLRHEAAVEAYLNHREQLAESVQQRLSSIQPDLSFIRARLLSRHNSYFSSA